MDKVKKLKKAIEMADQLRGNTIVGPIVKASPIELAIYNIFTSAKRQLESELATAEDALGIYTKGQREKTID